MCGIIGYTGERQAGPILMGGLMRLVYRGYDSAGVALQNGRGLEIRKVAGEVERLGESLNAKPVEGRSGIGHTRWATHGSPNEINAHPHTDCSGTLALVHNGIIENADSIRVHLEGEGHRFQTETDTEVLVHLIEAQEGSTLESRVLAALRYVEGTYGVAVMWEAEPDKIVVARHGSPVLLGLGQDGYFVSSDAAGVLEHTDSVVYLEDGDVAVVTPDSYRVVNGDAEIQVRPVDEVEWELEELELGGHEHFMLKEIFEQPAAMRRTIAGRLSGDNPRPRLNGLKLTRERAKSIEQVHIVACGTSWHAGLVGRHLIEHLAGIPVQVDWASEFRYRPQLARPETLTIAISQSGETADTLEAVRTARAGGSRVVGLVNVVGSTIARECEGGIYLHAGPEIGVASTKAFTAQVTALVLLALYLARGNGDTVKERRRLAEALHRLPASVERALGLEEQIRGIAEEYQDARTFLYLGRGISFPVALEGALKLKEISYLHAEGYPAAEIKHGPIALVEDGVPVVFVVPRDHLFSKTVSTIQEVKARGGRPIVVTTERNGEDTDRNGDESLEELADHLITVPDTHHLLTPCLSVIPLQLLAYHIAVLRGCNVDRPRNLAKSVTVE